MAPKYVLGLDAGSEGARCLVADLRGQPVAFASQPWSYDTPPDLAPLGKEFSPQAFWGVLCQVVREALGQAGVSPSDVLAVSATSQREGLVFLDSAGQEIYAGPNIDLRALIEGLSLDEEFGPQLYRITGHRPSFLFAPAKLRWFQNHRPRDYERIAHVLPLNDWITYRLCREVAISPSSAGEAGLLDIARRAWPRELTQVFDLPQALRPPLAEAGARVGRVTAGAAEQTGLAPGTVVALGGPDTQCGLLGMGVVEEGQAGLVAGWSASLQMALAQPLLDEQARIWTGCHLLPGKWVLEGSLGEAGSVYRWLKELLLPSADYDLLEQLARGVPPGAEGAMALLGPQAMDMGHLGVRLGGILFPVPLTVGKMEPRHLIRAFLENLCFAARANARQLEEIAGLEIKAFSLGGGLARSQLLAQILAHVLYRPVRASQFPHVSALGAAMCAAVAVIHSSLEDACRAMQPPFRTWEPEVERAAEYQECYQRWLKLSQEMARLSQEVL